MKWKQALSLGVVQGLTEFLPVSSSAHVSLAGRLFGKDPGAAFTAITQLGTEAAVLVYFRRDIARILKAWSGSLVGNVPRSDPDARMGWLIIVGSLPIGVSGLVFADRITGPMRNLWVTAGSLIGFSAVIGYADASGRQSKSLDELSLAEGFAFGLWQSLALIPGVSRSGGTIAGGLLMGYSRAEAARYSFLLAIPAVLASGAHQVSQISAGAGDTDPPQWGPIAGATAVSFGVGYAVIAWLLRYVSTRDLKPFVGYRVALGAALLGLLASGALPPDA